MKKRVYLATLFCATLLTLFTACSSDENIGSKQTVDVAKQITFKMDFVDYNAGDTIEGKTRAAQLETSRKQIIPMGNLFAEVSIKRDTTKESAKVKAATTRALADGRYSVYAYQGTTQKGVMTGTMASNTFTPDGGIDGMSLEPGTYTFICVNDKVNTSGNQWTVSRENIETALMGIAENVIIATAPKLQNVTFVMKHVGSRVRVFAHTECNPYIQSNIKATLSSTTNIPQQATFDPTSRSFTYGNTAAYSKNDLPALYPYTYLYFFPGTNLADLKVTLNGGTAFKLPVNNNRSWSFQNHSLAPNESYILNITLRYNYIYLYSDGTTGQYTDADFSSHTPVAIVVSRSKRLAVALNDAKSYSGSLWGTAHNVVAWSTFSTPHQSNTTMSSNFSSHLTDFNGEAYTHETTYSSDGIIKGNDQADYPAFYEAAHYNPGVTLTGSLTNAKWFLPTVGDWNLYYKNLRLRDNDFDGFASGKGYIVVASPGSYAPDDFGMQRGNGTPLYWTMDYGNLHSCVYLSSSENSPGNCYVFTIYGSYMNMGVTYPAVFDKQDMTVISKCDGLWAYNILQIGVRPFIHY